MIAVPVPVFPFISPPKSVPLIINVCVSCFCEEKSTNVSHMGKYMCNTIRIGSA